jgi:sugar lactone lactonase YvrE
MLTGHLRGLRAWASRRAAQGLWSNRERTGRHFLVGATLLVGGSALFAGVAGAAPVPSITTVAGNGSKGALGDGGPAVKAELRFPSSVTEDMAGSIYIADAGNNEVRKVVLPGTINQDILTTIAGTGQRGFGGDGGLATSASVKAPSGVAVNTDGDVFIADSGNNRIRKINTQGIITTFAGTGACGKKSGMGNGGPAISASFCQPTGIALDRGGDLFIADTGHNVVREVLPSGEIVAFAGGDPRSSHRDDRAAHSATLDAPMGVATNAIGDVYIVDTGHNRVGVVVHGTGAMTTFAGTGKPGSSGDGGPALGARLKSPTGLAVDPSGDVFISDTGNNRIREVNTAHQISTFAGTGHPGFSGDGGPAIAAQLRFPVGDMAADGSAVYFSDTFNQRVRGIFTAPPPVLPESNLAILLPLSGLLLVAGGLAVRRVRRRRRLVA